MPKTKVTYPWENNYPSDLLERFVFTSYSSWRKSYNLVLGLAQNILLPDRAFARPVKMIVEPSDQCNLGCPLCPTGRKKSDRKENNLSFDDFSKAVKPLSPYLYEIHLYNWGEPLLNPELFRFIGYCQSSNIRTIVSSNLTLFQPSMMDQIFDSGLDTLIISLDGASPGTYVKYRRRGDFNKVFGSLSGIVREKSRRKASRPRLVWQYIVFSHNQHEMGKAVEMAKQAGVDEIKFISSFAKMETLAHTSAGEKQEELKGYLPDDKRFHMYGQNSGGILGKAIRCPFLWSQIAVRTDGGIAACCGSYHHEDDFGSVNDDDILSVWNNTKYQQARRTLRTRGWSTSHTICDTCVKNGP